MLVLYYNWSLRSLVLNLGKLAAKLQFGDFEQKKIVHFFSQFFLESANRAALFDGESASASSASNFGQERERERRSQKVGSAQ